MRVAGVLPTLEQIEPRLLGVEAAAQYVGVSGWTIRSWVANGSLVPLQLPACHRPGEIARRILFDRADLDKFIDAARRA